MRSSRTYAAATTTSASILSPDAGSRRSSPNSHSQSEPGAGGVKPALPLATQQRRWSSRSSTSRPSRSISCNGGRSMWVPGCCEWTLTAAGVRPKVLALVVGSAHKEASHDRGGAEADHEPSLSGAEDRQGISSGADAADDGSEGHRDLVPGD